MLLWSCLKLEAENMTDADAHLCVEGEAVIGRAVQMNRQRGNATQRLLDVNQLLRNISLAFDKGSSRDSEVPIEPRMPNSSSVELNSKLGAKY